MSGRKNRSFGYKTGLLGLVPMNRKRPWWYKKDRSGTVCEIHTKLSLYVDWGMMSRLIHTLAGLGSSSLIEHVLPATLQ
jgi:hypothetical protein